MGRDKDKDICPFLQTPLLRKINHYADELDPGTRFLHQGRLGTMSGEKKKENLTQVMMKGRETSEERESTRFHCFHKNSVLSAQGGTDATGLGHWAQPKPEGTGCTQTGRVPIQISFIISLSYMKSFRYVSVLLHFPPGSHRPARAARSQHQEMTTGISAVGTGSFGIYFQNTP